MSTEQITLRVVAIVGFLNALTVAIGIWNRNHIKAITLEQQRVAENLAQVTIDGKELRAFLQRNNPGHSPKP